MKIYSYSDYFINKCIVKIPIIEKDQIIQQFFNYFEIVINNIIKDLKSKSAATNFKGHFSQIDSLSFSPDFTYLASGAQDGVFKLWDIRLANKKFEKSKSNKLY